MTKFIAIDGPGGAGKTYISNLLAKKLDASVFHLDDYGNDFEPFIGIPAMIDDLRKESGEVVIFEGIGVFKADFDEFKALRVFIETPESIRNIRVAGRDVPRPDRTAKDWEKIFAIWDRASEVYFTPELKASADLVVINDGNPDIELITSLVTREAS